MKKSLLIIVLLPLWTFMVQAAEPALSGIVPPGNPGPSPENSGNSLSPTERPGWTTLVELAKNCHEPVSTQAADLAEASMHLRVSSLFSVADGCERALFNRLLENLIACYGDRAPDTAAMLSRFSFLPPAAVEWKSFPILPAQGNGIGPNPPAERFDTSLRPKRPRRPPGPGGGPPPVEFILKEYMRVETILIYQNTPIDNAAWIALSDAGRAIDAFNWDAARWKLRETGCILENSGISLFPMEDLPDLSGPPCPQIADPGSRTGEPAVLPPSRETMHLNADKPAPTDILIHLMSSDLKRLSLLEPLHISGAEKLFSDFSHNLELAVSIVNDKTSTRFDIEKAVAKALKTESELKKALQGPEGIVKVCEAVGRFQESEKDHDGSTSTVTSRKNTSFNGEPGVRHPMNRRKARITRLAVMFLEYGMPEKSIALVRGILPTTGPPDGMRCRRRPIPLGKEPRHCFPDDVGAALHRLDLLIDQLLSMTSDRSTLDDLIRSRERAEMLLSRGRTIRAMEIVSDATRLAIRMIEENGVDAEGAGTKPMDADNGSSVPAH